MIWLFTVFGLGIIISSVTKLNRKSTYNSYDSRTNIYKFDESEHKYKL